VEVDGAGQDDAPACIDDILALQRFCVNGLDAPAADPDVAMDSPFRHGDSSVGNDALVAYGGRTIPNISGVQKKLFACMAEETCLTALSSVLHFPSPQALVAETQVEYDELVL